MSSICGDKLDKLACSCFEGEHLHHRMVELLLSHGFSQQVRTMKELVCHVIPAMEKKMRSDRGITFDIARKFAEENRVYDSNEKFTYNDESRLFFEAVQLALLYILNRRNNSCKLYNNYGEVRACYSDPLFKEVNEDEKNKIVQFANFMKAALLLVPNPSYKRKWLIELVYRVAEFKTERGYVTGSGMTDSTRRRKVIYEKESELSLSYAKQKIVLETIWGKEGNKIARVCMCLACPRINHEEVATIVGSNPAEAPNVNPVGAPVHVSLNPAIVSDLITNTASSSNLQELILENIEDIMCPIETNEDQTINDNVKATRKRKTVEKVINNTTRNTARSSYGRTDSVQCAQSMMLGDFDFSGLNWDKEVNPYAEYAATTLKLSSRSRTLELDYDSFGRSIWAEGSDGTATIRKRPKDDEDVLKRSKTWIL